MEPLFRKNNNHLQCLLCPHFCKISEGKSGICNVRMNTGAEIKLLTYGIISSLAIDPIEKKPLYHFYPGKSIFSIGSYGCNLKCDFCQNHSISQAKLLYNNQKTDPKEIVKKAKAIENNIGIAFTYNEPVIWLEYIIDVSEIARNEGLKTVLVSNGYINPYPLSEIIAVTDAFNIDLKAFNQTFYKKLTGGDLNPVKESLKQIAKSGRHLEVTTLIIPGLNDSEDEMEEQSKWMAGELGENTPFHISRYFPMFKREDPSTPEITIETLYNIASKHLNNVYTGNTTSIKGGDTYCHGCRQIVTTRMGYNISLHNIDKKGNCTNCGAVVYKYFIF